MTNPGEPTQHDDQPIARSRLVIASIGFVATVILVLAFPAGVRIPGPFSPLSGYLLVWLPLLVTLLVVGLTPRWRLVTSAVRWSIRPIDLLWGAAAGFVLRIAVSSLEILFYGGLPATAGGAVPLDTVDQVMFFIVALLAAVALAPIIEELFFRGLVLPSVIGTLRGGRWIAVVISGLLFAILHLLVVTTVAQAIVVGVGTLLVGLAAGSLAVVTGRLGPAIVTHVVFNTSILALGLTAVTGGTGVVIE
ncbi:CPBP family intramembrane metalloprotease [Plantibacter sp. VKM Ac-2880]|uniref:CPBP family intramembrane glutamic endopeptidase n=1 Tax=Plantibacter sp. VKM Ac-2880 TaxID=2783827 RepID=UPI001890A02D|nr:CPBP family intramembrane metalloprotease [Plantibacter sp. VKM Ac-2880]